jgi:hypothetical protein
MADENVRFKRRKSAAEHLKTLTNFLFRISQIVSVPFCAQTPINSLLSPFQHDKNKNMLTQNSKNAEFIELRKIENIAIVV